MDLIMFNPPAASAGKNFTTSRPSSIATSTSLGLEHPGVTGIPFSTQYFTKEAVSTMLGFKLLHVGVNNASEEAAASDSAKFATLLGQDVKVGNSSMFVGSLIEMMKNPGRGTCGHIAIQTNYLARAMYHLEKRGFVFDESSFKYDAKGNITVAYLKDEIAGFAVHFNQK